MRGTGARKDQENAVIHRELKRKEEKENVRKASVTTTLISVYS